LRHHYMEKTSSTYKKLRDPFFIAIFVDDQSERAQAQIKSGTQAPPGQVQSS
jgi:hypothetical protein